MAIFAAAPAVWIAITILFLMMGVVLSMIPLAGMLLLMPAAWGAMYTSYEDVFGHRA